MNFAGSVEKQVGTFGGEGFWVEVGAVGEDDDGQMVVGKTRDVSMEADGVAVMPHAGVIAVGV